MYMYIIYSHTLREVDRKILSYCHIVILSYCHIVILSYCHIVILSYCHIVILSYCHIVILSYCHIVILSPHRLPGPVCSGPREGHQDSGDHQRESDGQADP